MNPTFDKNAIRPFIDNIDQKNKLKSRSSGAVEEPHEYCDFVYNKVDDIGSEKGFQSFMATLLNDVTEKSKKKIDVVKLLNPESSNIKQRSLESKEKRFTTRGGRSNKKRRTVAKKRGTKRRH